MTEMDFTPQGSQEGTAYSMPGAGSLPISHMAGFSLLISWNTCSRNLSEAF